MHTNRHIQYSTNKLNTEIANVVSSSTVWFNMCFFFENFSAPLKPIDSSLWGTKTCFANPAKKHRKEEIQKRGTFLVNFAKKVLNFH